MKYSILFIVPFILSFFGSWIIKSYGHKLGIVDVPSERSSHERIIPKGGGIGILCSFILSGIYFNIALYFIIPAVFLSLISFFGDRVDINPKIRLIVQFLCCFLFLFGLYFLSEPGIVSLITIIPLAVFIAGTANFYNFMDGINGIAGITGFVAFLFLGIYGYINEFQIDYIYFSICISLSCLGFLPFNIPGAKVFMGDIGSVLLGFVFACFAVVFSTSLLDFFSVCGFLFLFYADELSTMYVRIKDGDSLSKPHRRHLYQIFANELGIDHWKVSCCFGFVQAVISFLIIFIRDYGFGYVFGLYFVLFCFFVFISFAVRGKIENVEVGF